MKNNLILKPWGSERILEKNKNYVLKKLEMKKNKRCSLQYHKKKRETIFVISGKLEITIGKTVKHLRKKIFKEGEFITISPKIIHRMKGITNCKYLEASTTELMDVVRLKDDFKRI